MHRIPTARLNQFFETRIRPRLRARTRGGHVPFLYAAQTGVAPPTFVLFTRSRGKLHFSMERFVINQLREEFGFYASPIRIIQKFRKVKQPQ